MFRTRWIRKAFDLPYSLGQRRRQVTESRKPVRLMLESLEERVTPCDSTSLVPGNIALNFYGNAHSPAFLIPVTVKDIDTGGMATSGTVSIDLVSGSSKIILGSATVGANGVADVSVDLGKLPANLSLGDYKLEETFEGNSSYFACSASGTLTISALATTIVPVTVTFSYSNTGNVTVTGSNVIPLGTDADNYAVLYEGTGGHTLHISNTVINGNVGIGGNGVVQCDAHSTITGTLDFSGSGSGQFSGPGDQGDDSHGNGDHGNKNGDHGDDDDDDSGEGTSGPSAINVNDAAVTLALNAINALSGSLAGLGTSLTINGTQTINESDGLLVTVNGVSYRVFNVTSYHMGDNDVLTIKGDGSGIPVVFNFGGKGDINLGGDVVLANGLVPDQVLWNCSTSGGTVHLHGNADDHPASAFQGIILAPNATIDLDNANLIGRIFGGDDSDMQIVGEGTITAPTSVVTIPTTTYGSFTLTVDVNSSTTPVSGGTVTFDLVVGNQTIDLGKATVGANGIATLTVTDQAILKELASLKPGTYELVETFSGSSPFAGCSTTTTLTITPTPTTIVVPGNINVTINNNTTYNITVNVNTPSGPATSGTVTLDLVVNGKTIVLGTGTVGPNGTVTVDVNGTTLSSLPPGQYQLVVNFKPGSGSTNANGSTTTTLTILPSAGPGDTTTTPTETITIVIPGNGISNFNGGTTTIPVVINGPSGPVSGGTVTITLLTPTGSEVIGSGPVSGGAAAVPVTVPPGLLPGTYPLLESFTDSSGTFPGNNAAGTLTVQPLNPLVAALELALDAAMIANMSNPGSVGELQMFSQVFLHQSVPTSLPQLLSTIQSLLPQTGSMLFPALQFAGFLDIDLPIENPM